MSNMKVLSVQTSLCSYEVNAPYEPNEWDLDQPWSRVAPDADPGFRVRVGSFLGCSELYFKTEVSAVEYCLRRVRKDRNEL